MTGKEKCRLLREVRRRIAGENGLSVRMDECAHEGPCAGTCPRCEQEVRALEAGLEKRRALGKRIALAGLCAGMVAAGTGCSVIDALTDTALTGDVPMPPATETPDVGAVEMLGEIPCIPEMIEGEIAADEEAPSEGSFL